MVCINADEISLKFFLIVVGKKLIHLNLFSSKLKCIS